MGMVAPLQRIASAFFVLLGRRGDVTRQAQQRGVHRQTLYRESRQAVVAVAGEEHCAELLRLQERVAQLERELESVLDLLQPGWRTVLRDRRPPRRPRLAGTTSVCTRTTLTLNNDSTASLI